MQIKFLTQYLWMDTNIQMSLFDKNIDSKSSRELMRTVDHINMMEIARIGFGNQGFINTWRMKRQIKSKRYTTKVEELPEVS